MGSLKLILYPSQSCQKYFTINSKNANAMFNLCLYFDCNQHMPSIYQWWKTQTAGTLNPLWGVDHTMKEWNIIAYELTGKFAS